MNMEQPFDIVIEGPINNGDGKARQRKKRLNCTCVISDKNPSKQPKLLVKEVTDVKDGSMINDEQDLPTVNDIMTAARLADWAERHQDIFTEGKVVNLNEDADRAASD